MSISSQIYEKQQKMITFLDSLHRKYKVLQKLTQKQSEAFDSEVILLLVDEDQNVDQKLYQDVITNIGIDAFVLDVLEKSMNRSYFCNQYQLKKNIGSIAENLEIQAKEVTRKMKIVQRKQTELNQRQTNIKNKLKQHALQIQKQLLTKLTTKQTQIKKIITSLLNNIKTKQKILFDRKQEIKQKLSELLQKQKSLISLKQKEIIKKNQNPQIQSNNEQIDISQHHMRSNISKQLKEMTKKYQQCKLQLEKLKKKNKTTQMAYSKAKSDIQAKDRDVEKLNEKIQEVRKQLEDEKSRGKLKDKQIDDYNKQMNEIKIESKAKSHAQKLSKQLINRNIPECNVQQKHELIDMLELLEISKIVHEDEANDQIKQNCNANDEKKDVSSAKMRKFIESKRKQQNHMPVNKIQVQQSIESKICTIKQINRLEEEQSLVIEHHFMQRKQKKVENRQTQASKQSNKGIKHNKLTIIAQSINNAKKKETDVYRQSQDEQQQVRIPQFLKKQQNNTNQSPCQVFKKIEQLTQSTKDPSESLIKSNLLNKFTQIPFFQHTKKLLVSYFDMLLDLIQQSNPNYYEVIQYISKPSFVSFFQKCYLSYQANLEIAQATTLLLSRILMMTSAHLEFQNQFVQAIQLRGKLAEASQSDDNQDEQFLKANINCLLSMIPI